MITRNSDIEKNIKNVLDNIKPDSLPVKDMGLLLQAVSRLYQATDDIYYMDYVYNAVNDMTEEDGKVSILRDHTELDRFILGNVFFFVYQLEKKKNDNDDNKFKKAILKMALELSDFPRNSSGNFENSNVTSVADAYASQVFYMNYETQFGGKEQYNDIIAQFNSIYADSYAAASKEEIIMYLCALIDTMEVMEQPLYEIYHRLQDLLKIGVNDVKESIDNVAQDSALFEAYAIMKACRMKALITEKYESIGEEVLVSAMDNYDQIQKTEQAAFIMAYAEGIRNRAYQDYGRNKGGALWS